MTSYQLHQHCRCPIRIGAVAFLASLSLAAGQPLLADLYLGQLVTLLCGASA